MSEEPARYRRKNGVVTYLEARLYLDRVFVRVRELAVEQAERNLAAIDARSPIQERGRTRAAFATHKRRMLEIINAAWQQAINDLVRCVLRKREKTKSRVTVRTVNWRKKALPSMSQSARRLRGEVRRSSARSHVKGRYVPKNPPGKRGRPSIPEREKKRRREIREAKRRSERRAATNAARVAKGWKPYRRARASEFRAGWWQSERRKQSARGRARDQARKEIATEKQSEKRKDGRKNHHPELGYAAPSPRRRRTSAQVERWGYSTAGVRSRGERAGGLAVAIASGVRDAIAQKKREAGAREYWRKVAKRAAEIANGARAVGRPLGSGDRKKRTRKKGANSGSFGRRAVPKNEALEAWKAEKGQILAELRREIGLATWSSKRVAVYRNDPIGKAQARQSMEYRNQRVERVRARLAAHWRAKPA